MELGIPESGSRSSERSEHRTLAVQVNEIAKKNDQQKRAGSCRDADLIA